MLNFLNTKIFFIDFDGVIVDSNNLKEVSIKESVYEIVGNNRKSNQALKFFNENAGIPRNQKLSLFFSNKDKDKIMNLYSSKCHEFYSIKKPTIGTDEFLSFYKKQILKY